MKTLKCRCGNDILVDDEDFGESITAFMGV